MAFPVTALPIRAEMYINGAWVNVSTAIRESDNITITGGQAPEQTSLTPCDISFSINNRDGLYSDDNPASAYYGLLPTNTPFRVSLVESGTFVYLPSGISQDPDSYFSWQSAYVSTNDKAVLDVTGDLDLRIEIEPAVWHLGSVGHTLAGKHENTTNQRSWFWTILPSGRMRLYWSTDGSDPTVPGTYADSTVPVPAGARIALRVTIDVNNGAAGRTITFYTSDSITGSWTQLGATVIQAGTTSIFSSSANLHVGAFRNLNFQYPFADASALTVPASLPLTGRLYRFQMYSGIAGTLVADMNATAQAEGTTSWSDGLGTPNTWTLIEDAVVTVADYRGYGEIAEMPQEWDGTGADIYIPTNASGIMRRITQGASAFRSPIFRNLRQFVGAGALAYITGEDGSRSTQAANSVPGQPAASIAGSVSFTSDDDMPGSDGVMVLNSDDALISGTVSRATAADWAFAVFYVKVPTAPLTQIEYFNLTLSGTIRRFTFAVSASGYAAVAYNSAGTSIGSAAATYGTGAQPGQWLAFQMRLSKNGTGVDLDIAWFVIGGTTFFGAVTTTVAAATVGAVTGYATTADAALARCSFAHLLIGNIDFEYAGTDFAPSSNAWAGETAGKRYLRVCDEEGVRARLIGMALDTPAMGPQPLATLPAVLDDCVTTDGGLQFEARDQPALVMRTRRSLLAQTAVELSYPDKHLSGSFRPVLDDYGLRNEITVTRSSGSSTGSSYVAELATGKRSVADVGRYDTGAPLNLYTDEQLPPMGDFLLKVGTFPTRRVPNVEVWLQRSVFVADATLTRKIRQLGPGSRLLITDVPTWVGGGDADTLARGYTETLKNRGHELAFSTVRYGPYDASLWGDTGRRFSLKTSLTDAVRNTTQTSFALRTLSSKGVWSTTAVPYDIEIAGEVMTVTAMSAATLFFSGWNQTATVVRSVNGVVKSHASGEDVRVADPGRWGL